MQGPLPRHLDTLSYSLQTSDFTEPLYLTSLLPSLVRFDFFSISLPVVARRLTSETTPRPFAVARFVPAVPDPGCRASPRRAALSREAGVHASAVE